MLLVPRRRARSWISPQMATLDDAFEALDLASSPSPISDSSSNSLTGCPTMSFSASSASSSETVTETENETPPLSPTAVSGGAPHIRFFQDGAAGKGSVQVVQSSGDVVLKLPAFDESDVLTPKLRPFSTQRQTSFRRASRAVVVNADEEADGYEAESEGRNAVKKGHASLSPRSSLRSKTRGATRTRAQDIFAGADAATESKSIADIVPHSDNASSTPDESDFPLPKRGSLLRSRRPTQIRIPTQVYGQLSDEEEDNITPKASTFVRGSMRCGKLAGARTPFSPGLPFTPTPKASAFQAKQGGSTANGGCPVRRPSLKPVLCDDLPSPIEALPSPLALDGDGLDAGISATWCDHRKPVTVHQQLFGQE